MDISLLSSEQLRAWLVRHSPRQLYRTLEAEPRVRGLVEPPSAADFFAGDLKPANRSFWLAYLERWPHELNFDPAPYLTDGVYESGHTNHPLYASDPETQYYEDLRQYVKAALEADLRNALIFDQGEVDGGNWEVSLFRNAGDQYQRLINLQFADEGGRWGVSSRRAQTLQEIEHHLNRELELVSKQALYIPLSSKRAMDTPASFYYNQVRYTKTHTSERQTSPRRPASDSDRPLKRSRTDVRAALNAAGGDVRAAAAALAAFVASP